MSKKKIKYALKIYHRGYYKGIYHSSQSGSWPDTTWDISKAIIFNSINEAVREKHKLEAICTNEHYDISVYQI